MTRLRPLSHTLALLAATNMSVLPVFADMQTATDTTATETTVTTTETADTTTTTTETTTVTTENLKDIIASLTSTDVTALQTRYNELLNLIAAKKYEITQLTDAEDITLSTTELKNMENLAAAFKAIIEGYEDSGAKTVVKTETSVDAATGDKITRTTYSDGSYTETVEAGSSPATDDSDSAGFNDYSDTASSSGGGGSDFLQQMLQNPMVQGLITGLLQQLMNGGLGSLSSLLGGQAASPDTGGTQKKSASDYGNPNPQSTIKTETRKTTTSTIDAINSAAAASAAASQGVLQGVPAGLQTKSSNGNANTNNLNFGGPR